MTDESTHRVPEARFRSEEAPPQQRLPPSMMPPADPWIGTAPIAPPGAEAPPPVVVFVERPRRRRWPWIVGGLLTITLLCCVGAAVIWTPISREHPAHLELGDHAAGFDRVRDPAVDRAVAELELQMFREYDVDDGLAAVLVDPATPERRLVLIAATKLILDPGGELDKAVRSISDRTVRNVTDFRHLGTHLTCADTEDDQGQAVIVCAWVDHGSIGLGIYYGAWTMQDAATALRDLRAEIVKRD